MSFIRWSVLVWAAAYLAFVIALFVSLLRAREWAIQELSSPEAQQQWQAWRDEELRRAQAQDGPVRRRPPSSAEPPLLVLLRDSFVGIVAGCLAIGSMLFAFLAFIVQSWWRSSREPRNRQTHDP